ncbi:MAG: PBSX family phage terminase large subunit, partial [Bacteroidales bacterium]|nr:PBSX family phage terminase large subunit [Bacteroidales bacterium]
MYSPDAFWLWRYTLDPSVRYIVLYGGSSSGKSFSVAQVLSLITENEWTNQLVMRKVGASIEKTIYADFRAAISDIPQLDGKVRFKQNSIVFEHGRIDFSGLDDPEKIKGVSNYKRVFLDELSEYDENDFKQIRLRLRGMEGQQIIAAFNPISEEHWIKKHWFDKEEWHDIPMDSICGGLVKPEHCQVKSVRMNSAKQILNPKTGEFEEHAPDTIVIQSTYLNNFWVVGSPDGTYGYYDYQAIANFERDRINDPDYYQVYALGEWGRIRTGAEFFPSFNRGTVCGDHPYNPELPIHVCMDSNVLPYVTATFFQKVYKPDDVQQVTQFAELPIES